MNRFAVDNEKYSATARQLAAEGAVLLCNENAALPLQISDTVALFGRTQCQWYKSGTGSGGMVNTVPTPQIAEAFRALGITLDETLVGVYEAWVAEHPFFKGEGWGQEPWSQPEMPLTDEIVSEAAKRASAAVITIGRTAGEDQDNKAEKGSYYLSDEEDDMIRRVTAAFDRVAVVLNVGNIIDMRWAERYKPAAILYAWHGGQEGANAIADVLTGRVNPCGKLADTIAYEIADYPSTENFGEDACDVYAEDIYVGYRYFESAARDKVLYPFGFGLSYTNFAIQITDFETLTGREDVFNITAIVYNTGSVPGKEVVQVYCEAPQGKLGKPAKVLCAYGKTKILAPGASEILRFSVPARRIASYDDSGITGHKSAWVLEPGMYEFHIGNSVRDDGEGVRFKVESNIIVQELEEALAPVTPFERLKNSVTGMTKERAPLRTVDMAARIAKNMPETRICTGNKGILLADVYDGFADIDAFIDQIPDDVLACIVRGEGMSSPKVTHGSAGGFGGLTDALKEFGIPPACCTDGPSGLRFDTGGIAFSLPNGTCIACSWNEALTEELFAHLGTEMRRDRVDLILGPGVNIHRNPLCGRNFEYFSEDPFITGSLAVAELRGLARSKVSGTIKHFTANNREKHRFMLDSVISERALREIYLKGYEIAARDGNLISIMTTYGMVNGMFTAGNYDLNTTILRGQWGYDGLVMTDWWACFSVNEKGEPDRNDLAAMVRAQNDLAMVREDTLKENETDNLLASLNSGAVTRAELHRCAKNILNVIMRTPALDRYLGRLHEEETAASKDAETTSKMGIVW